MLKVIDIVCGYGDLDIIKGISFDVENGQTKVLLSLNGSGKTTLLKSLSGIIPVRSGRIVFDGKDITNESPRERVRSGMLYVPEWGVFPTLTVRENLILASSISKGKSNLDFSKISELFPDLNGRLSERAASLSGGQRKILMLAMALHQAQRCFCLMSPHPVSHPHSLIEFLISSSNLKRKVLLSSSLNRIQVFQRFPTSS